MVTKKKSDDAEGFPGAPSEEKKSNPDDPKLLFYNAAGKKVHEGDPSAVKQYLSDDPNRPDASAEERKDTQIFGQGAGESEVPLLYFDAAGKQVNAPVSGGKQYTADDANLPMGAKAPKAKASKPDAPAAAEEEPAAEPAAEEPAAEAADEEPDEVIEAVKEPAPKAKSKPAADKARKSSKNK